MAYLVLDNRKPANTQNFSSVDKSWDKDSFKTLDEAYNYAQRWFGPYGEGASVSHYLKGFDYSGYGDIAQIVEVL